MAEQLITEAEVLAGQKAWCKALDNISATHKRGGQADTKALTEGVIDGACGDRMGAVLFMPTRFVVQHASLSLGGA